MAHGDWLFALTWLDDQFVVSGSRDTSVALWRIPDGDDLPPTSGRSDSNYVNSVVASTSSCFLGPSLDELAVPSYSHINAVSVKQCKSAQKVRDIVFNRRLQEVACVSLNGYIHVFAADKFVQVDCVTFSIDYSEVTRLLFPVEIFEEASVHFGKCLYGSSRGLWTLCRRK